ncbi:unnamed protein product, partial [Ixodes pacificus]
MINTSVVAFPCTYAHHPLSPALQDEEFGGFSSGDVRNAVQKLGHYNDDISSEPSSKDETANGKRSKTVSLRSTSKLVGRTNNLPPDPGGRDSKVPKLENAPRVRHLETTSSAAGQTKGEGARKTPGRQAAHRLLDRAKRGRTWTGKEEQSERGGAAALALKMGCFQLPAVSARSSRRIIPRKRYLEDSEDDAPKMLQRKRPMSQPSVEAPGDSPVVVLERLTAKEERIAEDGKPDADRDAELDARLGGERGAEAATDAEGDPYVAGTTRVGLFDRPLVVQGKRPWKPSLKVQMRLSEANLGSPFAFRGGSGSGGSRTSSDSCCRESIKRDMVSRYAEIMATKEDTVEVPANSPPGTSGGLLEDKVAAKIERLLKSQWENRLQGGTRKKNVVLRKARLRLSQRTLRRLRQPLDESPGEEGPREAREPGGVPEAAEGPARTRREKPHVTGVKRVPGSCDLSRKLKCKGCLLHACWTLFEIPATQKQHLQRHLVHLTGGPRHRQLTRKRKSSRSVGEGGLAKVSKGPRIKHVCRRAAVVLGHERATFSPPSSRISLSALSEEDKNLLVRGALEAEKTSNAPEKSSAAPSEATTDAKTPVASKLPGKPSLALQKKRLLAQPLRSYKSKVEQSRRLLLHTAAKKAKSKSKSKVTSKARAAMMASRAARKNGWREGGPVAKRETDDAVERRECKLEEGTGCDDANAASTCREWDRDVGGTVHSLDRVGGASSSAGRLQDKLQPKAYPPLVPKVVEHPLSSRQLSKKSVGHGNQPLVQSLFG